MLRYLPDDEENRAFLGYIKEKLNDGTENWKWVRNDVRRDQINELSDFDDPKATKYAKELGDADKKVQSWFKGLAKKATENGAAKDASADAKWPEEGPARVGAGPRGRRQPHEQGRRGGAQGAQPPEVRGQVRRAAQAGVRQGARRAQEVGREDRRAGAEGDAVEPDGTFVTAGLDRRRREVRRT